MRSLLSLTGMDVSNRYNAAGTGRLKVARKSYGRDLFNQALGMVFYDVTTLYFEIEKVHPRNLRKKGFNKDGKTGFCFECSLMPVNILAATRFFDSNTFERHTLPQAIAQLKKEYNIHKIIIVAVHGMIRKENIEAITGNGYEFIAGERLKNLLAAMIIRDTITKLF